MRPEPVSAIVRDEMTIEVSSPTLGIHVLLIDELIEIMEKATEAVGANPTRRPSVLLAEQFRQRSAKPFRSVRL